MNRRLRSEILKNMSRRRNGSEKRRRSSGRNVMSRCLGSRGLGSMSLRSLGSRSERGCSDWSGKLSSGGWSRSGIERGKGNDGISRGGTRGCEIRRRRVVLRAVALDGEIVGMENWRYALIRVKQRVMSVLIRCTVMVGSEGNMGGRWGWRVVSLIAEGHNLCN